MIYLIGLAALGMFTWAYAVWRLRSLAWIIVLGLCNALLCGALLDIAYGLHPDQARYGEASIWPLTISMAVAWTGLGWALRTKIAAWRAARHPGGDT